MRRILRKIAEGDYSSPSVFAGDEKIAVNTAVNAYKIIDAKGINIQKSHPVEKSFEIYWLMIDEEKYAFQRETFTNLWYFGADEDLSQLIPCSLSDYEAAKKGALNPRLLKN